MDVLAIMVVIAGVSASITIIVLNARETAQPLPRRYERTAYTEYLLPPPGQHFELYRRAKEVMDGLVADRDSAAAETCRIARRADNLSARLESSSMALEETNAEVERLLSENAELRTENETLRAKIISTQDLVRSYTHPKMDVAVSVSPRRWISAVCTTT